MQSAASMVRKQSWCAALYLGQSMLADGCACRGVSKAKSPLHVKIALCDDQETLLVADTAVHQT